MVLGSPMTCERSVGEPVVFRAPRLIAWAKN
jgi:hypothetical protein